MFSIVKHQIYSVKAKTAMPKIEIIVLYTFIYYTKYEMSWLHVVLFSSKVLVPLFQFLHESFLPLKTCSYFKKKALD